MASESLLPHAAAGATLVTGSETWQLDLDRGRVTGRIDGEAAVCQAAMLALSIPRFQYLIYSSSYGHELESLIGRDFAYLSAAAPTLITEALSQDDRITRVSDFQFTQLEDQVEVTFTMTTSQGEQQVTFTL